MALSFKRRITLACATISSWRPFSRRWAEGRADLGGQEGEGLDNMWGGPCTVMYFGVVGCDPTRKHVLSIIALDRQGNLSIPILNDFSCSSLKDNK